LESSEATLKKKDSEIEEVIEGRLASMGADFTKEYDAKKDELEKA